MIFTITMCITIIFICHRHMLATTTHHQNKFYSESIRQYAKEGLKHYFHQLTYLLKILNVTENYITFRCMSGGCHLMVQCQKHAKISCGKVQLTYIYKITFPISIDTYH